MELQDFMMSNQICLKISGHFVLVSEKVTMSTAAEAFNLDVDIARCPSPTPVLLCRSCTDLQRTCSTTLPQPCSSTVFVVQY